MTYFQVVHIHTHTHSYSPSLFSVAVTETLPWQNVFMLSCIRECVCVCVCVCFTDTWAEREWVQWKKWMKERVKWEKQKCTRYIRYTDIKRVSCHKMIQLLAIMSLHKIVAYNVRACMCMSVFVCVRAFAIPQFYFAARLLCTKIFAFKFFRLTEYSIFKWWRIRYNFFYSSFFFYSFSLFTLKMK